MNDREAIPQNPGLRPLTIGISRLKCFPLTYILTCKQFVGTLNASKFKSLQAEQRSCEIFGGQVLEGPQLLQTALTQKN